MGSPVLLGAPDSLVALVRQAGASSSNMLLASKRPVQTHCESHFDLPGNENTDSCPAFPASGDGCSVGEGNHRIRAASFHIP